MTTARATDINVGDVLIVDRALRAKITAIEHGCMTDLLMPVNREHGRPEPAIIFKVEYERPILKPALGWEDCLDTFYVPRTTMMPRIERKSRAR